MEVAAIGDALPVQRRFVAGCDPVLQGVAFEGRDAVGGTR
jgi:hypothetical protein